MKRFYDKATVVPAQNGYVVELDGRGMKTPARAAFIVPTQRLADAIAAEWDAQVEEVHPQAMPLTGLANAALDMSETQRSEIVQTLAGYANTDLLCYRADSPADLRAVQDARWQPLLDWGAARLGVAFRVTSGIVPVAQDKGVQHAAHEVINGLDAFALMATGRLIQGLGSFVLGLAVAEAYLDVNEAFAPSHLDEEWQESRWGADAEAAERRQHVLSDMQAAARFRGLAQPA